MAKSIPETTISLPEQKELYFGLEVRGKEIVKPKIPPQQEEEIKKREKRSHCPECGSPKLVRDYHKAELVCAGCGYVIDEKIRDMGPEWRAFDQEQRERRGRVGPAMTFTIHDKGLSTTIDWRDMDSKGKQLTPKNRAQIYRLRKWQERIRVSESGERNLAIALGMLDRMASQLGLPRNVREAAAFTYRRAAEKKLIRGRSIEGVAAASLYAACRECKVPRTLNEIAAVLYTSKKSISPKKEISRSYRYIARELPLRLKPTSAIDYVPKFGSELGLSGEAQSKAIELLREAKAKGLTSGRGPTGVAAAAIYIAGVICGERRIQRDVADVARVTEVTVRNRYKEICEKLGLEEILYNL